MSKSLFSPLRLPNGSVIPNRLAKAAMEENLADADQAPGDSLYRLYQRWASGGVGLIITGNVMVDGTAMTGPGDVVLENDRRLSSFERWARSAGSGGAQVWMQLNHPGRQVYSALGQTGVAPSPVPVDIPGFSKMFARVRELRDGEIQAIVNRFVNAAQLAERAGFTGVQVHAAHGYLLSQFLSPLVNRRTDGWGGLLENRARLLLDIVRGIRSKVSASFCVAVKLNSADFQRGGFDLADACEVVKMLNRCAVDLIELSGGSYEAPAMQGQARDGRTLAREAWFLEFAQEVRKIAQMPLMVTGGIRRREIAEGVLAEGIEMIGMATALAVRPELPVEWQAGRRSDAALPAVTWKNKVFASLATQAMVKRQLHRLSVAGPVKPAGRPLLSLVCDQWKNHRRGRQYKRWIQTRT
ncbi:NADH:flavin oxidoreductase/NADH oxidase family protein [Burkholderia humptydooensis]|uniref:NADH:flavin oxidoreductase/NADH oxidase family protein n=2 Tax=Burkholderia humptydooensis TaxID=430531 RepID=A0A7U4P558_9BURK|nr:MULTISPECIES: NADH:flavin oxidoreductase/NADH oxidase family protein [Burkholderia]AJY43080.1 flavin oxidoreductase / NADH oxidase family protein [Burkholderia sp. 2002721687]ALX43158.1 2,4-dienoyl-CoA reductase [Burkholderia humptydooensis]EIP84742.1 2,4-dienoyl-CoA reductase [Burkholderia humptydooensis MSMB43]QPS44929.1 NADH:flavin oxidoreductase/NADH oxidase family protein [Burkholderia humptydooensis]